MSNVRPFWIAWCCAWALGWFVFGFFTFGLGWIGLVLSLLAILIPVGAPAQSPVPQPLYLAQPPYPQPMPHGPYPQQMPQYRQGPLPHYRQMPPYRQLPPGGWHQ
jgi:hypothetical protein